MFIVEANFSIGDTVYLLTDKEQSPCLIVSLTIYANDYVEYGLSHNGEHSTHSQIELISEPINAFN